MNEQLRKRLAEQLAANAAETLPDDPEMVAGALRLRPTDAILGAPPIPDPPVEQTPPPVESGSVTAERVSFEALPEGGFLQTYRIRQEWPEPVIRNRTGDGVTGDDRDFNLQQALSDRVSRQLEDLMLNGGPPPEIALAGSPEWAEAHAHLCTGRSPSGRLRNFRAMGEVKLRETMRRVSIEANDREADIALRAEFLRRDLPVERGI